jgi:hypothetical protein
VESLQKIPAPPDCQLSTGRLVSLAAAASTNAEVSSRLEIYPHGMDAARTLKLASGALLGTKQLTVEEIRARVSSRYPAAQPLPDRPKLDELLRDTGLDLEFDASAEVYRPHIRDPFGPSSSSSVSRLATTVESPAEITPEVADARDFELRLRRAERDGAFLLLSVQSKYLLRAESELVSRFQVKRLSVEQMLVRALRAEADKAKATWRAVLDADRAGPDGKNWRNLKTLLRRAIPHIQAQLSQEKGGVLLVYPNILARYEEVGLLEWVRDQVNRRDGIHGAWILVPTDVRNVMPTLDGVAIPVLTRAQWEQVPEGWLANRHRSNGGTPTAPAAGG